MTLFFFLTSLFPYGKSTARQRTKPTDYTPKNDFFQTHFSHMGKARLILFICCSGNERLHFKTFPDIVLILTFPIWEKLRKKVYMFEKNTIKKRQKIKLRTADCYAFFDFQKKGSRPSAVYYLRYLYKKVADPPLFIICATPKISGGRLWQLRGQSQSRPTPPAFLPSGWGRAHPSAAVGYNLQTFKAYWDLPTARLHTKHTLKTVAVTITKTIRTAT